MAARMHPDISPEELKGLKRLTLKKLGQVSAQIEELLAGQNVTLLDMPLPGDPDPEWTKLIRLRMYKKMLNDTVKRMNEGPYGFCRGCEEPIPKVELEQMPWAEICGACAARGVEVIAH